MIALVGVALGAVVSYAATALTDRARWRRESTVRWEGRLFDAIVAFAAALKMQSRTCLRIAGSYWPSMTTNPIDPAEGGDLIARFEDERSGHFERLLLLAPADIVSSARAWQESVWALHLVRDGPSVIEHEALESRFATASRCREAFYDSARRAIGVSGTLAPTPVRKSSSDPTWQSGP